MTATPPISPAPVAPSALDADPDRVEARTISPAPAAPSALVAAHERLVARKNLERELAASQAKVAELERAASRPQSPSPSVPTAVVAVPVAASSSDLWARFDAAETLLAKNDAALAISAHAAGKPIPESIGTEAGRAARVAELSAVIAEEKDIRLRSRAVAQYAALSRGVIPDRPEFALSAEAVSARREVIQQQLAATTCPREKYRLAGLLPR